MSLKAKVEAIIYAAEEPITLEQISVLLKDVVLADLASTKENLAIEQADTAAEALAEATSTANDAYPIAANASAEETEQLPELAPESPELITPEPGPLMPQDAISAGESSEEPPLTTPANTEQQSPPETEQKIQADSTSEEYSAQDSAPEASAPDAETPAESALPEPSTSEAPAEPGPAESATVTAPETTSRKRQPKKTEQEIAEDKAVRTRVRDVLVELIGDYASEDRGMEIRQVAGGFRMATKPEHHDVVRAFAKSLKPPIRLSLAALETLAVVAYKQPITGPEIADIRGVESASVLGTLLDRKLITTAGRKQVIGRPMQYKTSKDFLMRFGLNDVNELPSMEEFSQLASEGTIEIAPTEAQETPSLFEGDSRPAAPNEQASDTTESGNTAPSDDERTDSSSPQVQSESELVSADVVSSNEVSSNEVSLDQISPDRISSDEVSSDLEAHDEGSQIPESQPETAEATDSQSQSEAEPSNVPEAEHPIGHQ